MWNTKLKFEIKHAHWVLKNVHFNFHSSIHTTLVLYFSLDDHWNRQPCQNTTLGFNGLYYIQPFLHFQKNIHKLNHRTEGPFTQNRHKYCTCKHEKNARTTRIEQKQKSMLCTYSVYQTSGLENSQTKELYTYNQRVLLSS